MFWKSSVLSLVGLCSALNVFACQIPVFRYALEHWAADKYEIAILHEGPLDSADSARLSDMRTRQQGSGVEANYIVRTHEIGALKDEQLAEIWRTHGQPGRSIMVVLYPRNAREVPDPVVRVSPFNDESIQNLTDSPVRQEIARRLLDGDSAVWIFVPCGDADQDKIAIQTLTEQVQWNQDELKLPPQDEIEADALFNKESNIELRLDFSIVTLHRNAPEEKFLLQLLLASESDLETLKEPMAFPLFGRGRVLYALVGKGIARDTIESASRFIIGPCSCQVKEQNPGFDLLLSVDWDHKVGSSILAESTTDVPAEPVLLKIPPGKSAR